MMYDRFPLEIKIIFLLQNENNFTLENVTKKTEKNYSDNNCSHFNI